MNQDEQLSPDQKKDSSPVTSSESRSGNKNVGQGAFSLKPASRKKPIDWKIVGVIAGGIIITLLIIISFAAAVIKSNARPEPEIDESKVNAEAVTQVNRTPEDVMGAFMEKNRHSISDSSAGKKTDDNQKDTAQAKDTTETAIKTKPAEDAEYYDKTPPVREEEDMFSPVTRFDSAGISQGVGGSSSGRSSSDTEERLRAFANADPDELVKQALANQGGGDDNGLSGGSSGRGSVRALLGSSGEYAITRARRSPDRKFLLKRQTRFQCVLYNRVKTDYPGFVSCYLLRPLYSSDGSVILAEAGAELTGEQTVEVKAGQSSVFTSWSELETAPDGIRASLSGLGTDPMGSSGTEAYIDNHYGKKFGGAVMLSFIQDALGSVSNLTKRNSGNGYTVENSEQNAEDMASKALENSINIPPTGYVLPGTVITVIVAQDIDFSSVYKTRTSR